MIFQNCKMNWWVTLLIVFFAIYFFNKWLCRDWNIFFWKSSTAIEISAKMNHQNPILDPLKTHSNESVNIYHRVIENVCKAMTHLYRITYQNMLPRMFHNSFIDIFVENKFITPYLICSVGRQGVNYFPPDVSFCK